MKTRKYAHVKDNYSESPPSNNNNNYSDERGDDYVFNGAEDFNEEF